MKYSARGIVFTVLAISMLMIYWKIPLGSQPSQPSPYANYSESCEPDWLFQTPDLPQNSPALINYIRKYHLTPASKKPYALDNPRSNPSQLWNVVSPYLNLTKGYKGFFIEAGANDGEFLSNTLALERDYGWNGLLVEANIVVLSKLFLRHRKAWIADVGLSYTNSPIKIQFYHREGSTNPNTVGMGMLKHSKENSLPVNVDPVFAVDLKPKDYTMVGFVECFPLFSLLAALNVTEVDYFALDIQGPELKVLKTIPFDLVNIKVISVEYVLDPEGAPAVKEFLELNRYKVVGDYQLDFLAVREDYLKTLNIP